MSNLPAPALTVSLGDRSYPVYIVENRLNDFPAILERHFPARKLALVTNTTIAFMYHEQLESLKRTVPFIQCVIPDGEQYKTIETWSAIIDTLLQARIDRTTVLLALGGGVVGDMAGFAAASVLRGIECVQIPTTLLAMVDSSVGGKTGINHQWGKNLIGAFHQPSLVWVDVACLATLPRREYIAGMAEIIKNAFIGGRAMFDFIAASLPALLINDPVLLRQAIERSIQIKADIVSQDERETGVRALLNFGHTFAHSLEHFYGYGTLLHGEAVLLGIRCACELSKSLHLIQSSEWPLYQTILANLPVIALPSSPDGEELYTAMFSDKKTKQGALRFVLPTEAGSSSIVTDVPKEKVIETIGTVLTE